MKKKKKGRGQGEWSEDSDEGEGNAGPAQVPEKQGHVCALLLDLPATSTPTWRTACCPNVFPGIGVSEKAHT